MCYPAEFGRYRREKIGPLASGLSRSLKVIGTDTDRSATYDFVLTFHSSYRRAYLETFLPRDAMRKRGLCCRSVSVRLSVRPSVTLVYCIQTDKDIVNLLSRPAGSITLVFFFDSQRRYLFLIKENPFSGAQNTMGWEMFAIFDGNRRLSRRYEISP